MRWSNKLPDEEGYYWFRDCSFAETGKAIIVHIFVIEKEAVIYSPEEKHGKRLKALGYPYQLAGPIPIPEFKEVV